MRYAFRSHRDVVLAELSGSTWGTLSELQLKDEISAAIALGRKRFILDFAQVGFVSSMGLGIVVASWASIKNAGGELVLCGLSPRVRSVVQVSGLDAVLEFVPDLPAALARFAVPPEA